MKKQFVFLLLFMLSIGFAQTQTIILGRPTDTSITASVLFDANVQFYIEYGTQSATYSNSTAVFNNTLNVPDEIELTNLNPNTQYFYRLQYKLVGNTSYTATPEYKFHTQRAPGSTFNFTVEADEHLYGYGDTDIYQITLANEAAEQPDFMLSLGDIFGDDHSPTTTTSADMDNLHKFYRQYLGQLCHSVPFYVCLGNHEGENDYYLAQTPPDNIAVWGTMWRKYYYPNPSPNSFYSGNTAIENFGIDSPENYYAWTWGDALFVVLDVYRTELFPGATPADPTKPTNWDWTLGYTQYQWMRNILETSTATHKFVFAHHTRGQGRGGIGTATGFEWGGMQGNQYKFDQYRPGWGKPIHQVFVDTGVDIFFQGHDHLFAKEQLNGVVYQEVPMPSDNTYTFGYSANATAYTDVTLDGTGHVKVNVTPECVTVDYVKSYLPQDTTSGLHANGEIGYSYTLGNCGLHTAQNELELDFNAYPNPANTTLNLNFKNKSTPVKAALYNSLGQLVLAVNSNSVDVSALVNGLYFIKLDDYPSGIKKIIIQHE